MRSRAAARPAPVAAKPRAAAPSWLRPLILALTGVFLLCSFSGEAKDSDMWWHLATGKYIWQNHRLPVPDPFSFTTDMGTPVYPGELTTRHFNLTHEWGMELIYYVLQAYTGFGGLILFRAMLLMVFCGVTGWLAARRSGSFYRGIAACVLSASIASTFAEDRAYLASFAMLALTVAAFETRRFLWLLAPAFLVWSNLHGGFLMGWAVAGAYSAEAVWNRLRGKPFADERKIWMVTGLCLFATFWNPNGWHVIDVMRHYRDSPLQISILEWNYPAWWPPDKFNVMMVATLGVLLWARQRVRLVDWLLFAALGGAAAMALRNVIFVGFIGPLLLATYLPSWKRPAMVKLEYAAAAVLVVLIGVPVARGRAVQLHAAQWQYPGEAADFLIAHGFTGRIFNTYEQGGYLMWRLWPRVQVFVDGRALNESAWNDYHHMIFNADYQGGKTTNQMLRDYGVRAIVINGFNPQGQVQLLAAALADPSQKEWKLVYQDQKELVYMRDPLPGMQVLPSLTALDSIEAQCDFYLEHNAILQCARELGDLFNRIGDHGRARKWAARYAGLDADDPAGRARMLQLAAQ